MNNALEINNAKKTFIEFTLNNISFTLPRGFIMGFIGPNGAGKTTTIKLIMNMVRLEGGDIRVLGCDHGAEEEKIKQRVGIVFDQPYFVDEWTVRDVETTVKPFYREWDSKTYNEYLSRFSLLPGKKVKELSRGMKMKLMLAVALSHNAELLILDEPTSGLDPVARDELLEILGSYIEREDRSVLFSTHITSDLEKIADYITFINNGRIVYSGTKDGMLESYCMIKGGREDLKPERRAQIIGLREHGTGFEGLIRSELQGGFPSEILFEQASLDDIVVYFNKGAV